MLDRTFRLYKPDQLLLLPPSLGDWLPEDHHLGCGHRTGSDGGPQDPWRGDARQYTL